MVRFLRRFSSPLRKWHRRLGLAILVPCAVVSLTGIFLVHPGLYEVPRADALPTEPLVPELAAEAMVGALHDVVGRRSDFRLKHVDVRFRPGDGWLVIIKGIDAKTSAELELPYQVDTRRNTITRAENPASPPPASLKKWVKSLHTGEIFGKAYGWLWADFVGAFLIVLTVSGLFVYLPTIWTERRNTPGGRNVSVVKPTQSENPEVERGNQCVRGDG